MSLGRWMGVARSAVGRGHLAKKLPCQDASDVRSGSRVAAIVASDGAGSAKHSHHGAAGAVEVTIQVLQETVPWTDPEGVRERILGACLAEMDKRADRLGCPVAELAATLAFVAVTHEEVFAGNLGDGVVAAFRGDNSEVLIAPERGEFANETVFLTSSRATRSLRIVKKPRESYDGFAVMSDGAADSLYRRRDGTLAPALIRVLSRLDDDARGRVGDAIDTEVMPLLTNRTSDDCTLAVMRHVRVTADALSQKSEAFQMEFLGTGNRRGLRTRLAVLDGYRQGKRDRVTSEITGLSERTVRLHRRAVEVLCVDLSTDRRASRSAIRDDNTVRR